MTAKNGAQATAEHPATLKVTPRFSGRHKPNGRGFTASASSCCANGRRLKPRSRRSTAP